MSIHQRIINNFEDSEYVQQDKSANKVGSNYSFHDIKQLQSGQVVQAARNVYLLALHSLWVEIKGKGKPSPHLSLRFNLMTYSNTERPGGRVNISLG